MKENIRDVFVDLNTLLKKMDRPKENKAKEVKYYISFSNAYEIFEDVREKSIYENDNGELLLSIINKKEIIFSSIIDFIDKTKENTRKVQKAVIVNLFDHYQFIEELKQRLISEGVNQSIVEMLCEDLGEYVNNYLEEYDKFLTEYNSNRKDKIDLEELLTDREKLEKFVELPDFNEYFVHDKNDIRGVKAEIRENIELIEKSNSSLIEKNNNLLAGMYNYLYSIITFFMIVDRQIERKTNDDLEDLLIEPLNIPRSETNFEKIPQTRRTKKDKIEGQLQIVTRYEIASLDELLNIYIRDIIDNKIIIKKCKNCGSYFLPNNKQVYCEECKGIPYDMKKNTSEIRITYRNNYKNQHNKMARNMKKDKNIREKFNIWNQEAKEMTKKCENGKITLEELKVWFKESQRWNKKNI